MAWQHILIAAVFAAVPTFAQTQSPHVATGPGLPVSSAAERIYDSARPRLLQIRTLLAASDQQTTLGSGFLVSADGLALTNYHVVSQFALDPDLYRLEYAAADDTHGKIVLLAVDVADDLAVVRIEHPGVAFFASDDRAVAGSLPKGERIYSMGNPLDLGFSIVEGTFNGLVEHSYQERIHFSGALNPGMSGGPNVTEEGAVVGVNVAKQYNGELVSFLVPARFAAALVTRAAGMTPPDPHAFQAEVSRQLVTWQDDLYRRTEEAGFKDSRFGPYTVPESADTTFTCWASTNVNQVPKPRADESTTRCDGGSSLFVAEDLGLGAITIAHSWIKSIDLNALQFATFVSGRAQPNAGRIFWDGVAARKWHTRLQCDEDFVAAEADRPPLRLVWCARAYRKLEGLYDISVSALTQDRSTEALVSHLNLQGVSYPNALALGRRFIDQIRWSR